MNPRRKPEALTPPPGLPHYSPEALEALKAIARALANEAARIDHEAEVLLHGHTRGDLR